MTISSLGRCVSISPTPALPSEELLEQRSGNPDAIASKDPCLGVNCTADRRSAIAHFIPANADRRSGCSAGVADRRLRHPPTVTQANAPNFDMRLATRRTLPRVHLPPYHPDHRLSD
jgi:hypothetical protein